MTVFKYFASEEKESTKPREPPEPSEGPLEVLGPDVASIHIEGMKRTYSPVRRCFLCVFVSMWGLLEQDKVSHDAPTSCLSTAPQGVGTVMEGVWGQRLPLSEASSHSDRLGGVGGRPGPDSRK